MCGFKPFPTQVNGTGGKERLGERTERSAALWKEQSHYPQNCTYSRFKVFDSSGKASPSHPKPNEDVIRVDKDTYNKKHVHRKRACESFNSPGCREERLKTS